MEYLSGGSLNDFIKKVYGAGKFIKTIDASVILRQILEAVAYLHEFDIAHRDLKPGINLISIYREHNVF